MMSSMLSDETSYMDKTQNANDTIWIDPERMSGAPCFRNTRVPVQHLFDYLAGGDSLETFLEDFDGVTREQATEVLRRAGMNLVEDLRRAA